MKNSRSKNTILNITFGYTAQIGILILSFISRRIFLRFLSIDFLGINGLYSNILTVLSLAELGLDSAVVFSLYKPVADDNKQLIKSLLRYFRRIYAILALVIFVIGILLIPFLGFIIKTDLPLTDLIAYYILFLINTVSSYFVAHKVALLSAYQEQRIQKIVSLYTNILLQLLHIIVLLIWKNYYIYIVTNVIGTIINSVVLGLVCDHIHPEIKCSYSLIPFDKKPIIKRIFSTFLYKTGAVAINNTDNLLISIMVNTASVGLYSNYIIVVNAIQGFISIITTSLISGIGNLSAQGDKKRQQEIFNMMLLFYHFIAITGGTGFYILFNDLINIWLGDQYIFNQTVVFAIAFNFYLTNAVSPVWMYREANGLFEQVRYLMLITAFCNIIFSIILGYIFGVFGVLFATALSRIITSVWYEPNLLYKNVFNSSPKSYWLRQIKYFIISGLIFGISYISTIYLSHSISFMIMKAIIIVVIASVIFYATNFRSKELRSLSTFLIPRRKP